MKTDKYSVAGLTFIIAILATVLVKGEDFGRKVVSDCYGLTFNIVALNGADPRTLTLGELAAQATADVAASPYLNQNITSSPIDASLACPADEVFCCASFVKLPDNTQGVSVRTINGISGKWQVYQLFFDDISE